MNSRTLQAIKEQQNCQSWSMDTQSLLAKAPVHLIKEEICNAMLMEARKFCSFIVDKRDKNLCDGEIYRWEGDRGSCLRWVVTENSFTSPVEAVVDFQLLFNLEKDRSISNTTELVLAEMTKSIELGQDWERFYNKVSNKLDSETVDGVFKKYTLNHMMSDLKNKPPVVRIPHFEDEIGMFTPKALSDCEDGFCITFVADMKYLDHDLSTTTGNILMIRPCQVHQEVQVNFSGDFVTTASDDEVKIRDIEDTDLRLLRKGGVVLLQWLEHIMKY